MNKPEIIGHSQDGPTDQWGAKLQMQSAEASCESTGPLPVVGSGDVGGVRVESASVFEALHEMATSYEDVGQERTADTIRLVAEMYRRHAGHPTQRQPEPTT